MKELLKTCNIFNKRNIGLIEKVNDLYKTYQKELYNYLEELEKKFGILIDRDDKYDSFNDFLTFKKITYFHTYHDDIYGIYYIHLSVGYETEFSIPLDHLFDISLAKENLIKRIKLESSSIEEDIEDLKKKISEYKEIIKNIQNL